MEGLTQVSSNFVEPQKTFAQAKFAIERRLSELGVALDLSRLQIGLDGEGKHVTIIHPTRDGWIVISQFLLPEPIDNPGHFDASPYVAAFAASPIAH